VLCILIIISLCFFFLLDQPLPPPPPFSGKFDALFTSLAELGAAVQRPSRGVASTLIAAPTVPTVAAPSVASASTVADSAPAIDGSSGSSGSGGDDYGGRGGAVDLLIEPDLFSKVTWLCLLRFLGVSVVSLSCYFSSLGMYRPRG
jgi:hypothetical protein